MTSGTLVSTISDRLIGNMSKEQCENGAKEVDVMIKFLADVRKGFDVLEQQAHEYGERIDDAIGRFERVSERFETAVTDKMVAERENNEQS